MSDKCIYPDWMGGYDVGHHIWDKDRTCCICGKIKKGKASCNQKVGASVIHQEGTLYRWCAKHQSYCFAEPT